MLNRLVKNGETTFANSFNKYGCSSSGPQDFPVFSLESFSNTWSSVNCKFSRIAEVLKGKVGGSSCGSIVKFLQNCFWRISHLSLLLWQIDVGSSWLERSGATPDLVFKRPLARLKNGFGLPSFACLATASSWFFLSQRVWFLTLFLALFYFFLKFGSNSI